MFMLILIIACIVLTIILSIIIKIQENQNNSISIVQEPINNAINNKINAADNNSVIVNNNKHDFKLVGSSFNNEDGISRQELLRKFYNHEEPFNKSVLITLEKYQYKGEPAVKVLINGIQIGNAPKEEAPYITKLIDEHPKMGIGIKIIVGGTKNFGAYIKMRWKDEF